MRAKHALRKDVEKCAFICAPVPQDFVPQMMAIWLYSGKFDEKGQNLIENRLNLMANDGESAQMWCFSAISTFFRPFSTFILTSALKLLRLGHNWGTNWGTRRYAEISLKHISVGFGTDFDKFMTSATFKKMVRNNPKKPHFSWFLGQILTKLSPERRRCSDTPVGRSHTTSELATTGWTPLQFENGSF